MNKFKKGDRVVTKSGTHGYIEAVLDGGWYAVKFDGRETSKVQEYLLKPEGRVTGNSSICSTNSVVANALEYAKNKGLM